MIILIFLPETINTTILKNIARIHNYIGKSPYVENNYFKGKFYSLKITEASGKMILWYDFTNSENYIDPIEYTKSPVGTVILEEDILGYFVWIPRYEYLYTNLENNYVGATIDQPGEIKLQFLTGTSNATIPNYALPPVFTLIENH